MRVVVVGAGGYVGGELLRLLLQHPEVTELSAVSRSQAGKPFGDVHPALAGVTDARFIGDSPAEAARGRDVVFLSLEHGESSRVMDGIIEADAGLVVDLAADFRVQDPRLHEQFYGRHPAPELVHRFVYGLADVEPERLRGARAIAAPGCFATAAQLALYPLARIGAARPALFGVTGSSGAGVHPKASTHHPARAHNLFAYGVLGHRHEAEILEQWRRWTGRADAAARLMPHSGPFVRGIHLTLHAHLDGAAGEPGRAARAYADAYAGRRFVRVTEAAPELTHVVGTNMALVHARDDGRELQAMIVIDNLIKGAGGQAIQAMNLALGLDEGAGLAGGGYYPC